MLIISFENEWAVWNPSISFNLGKNNVSIDFYVIGSSSGYEWNEEQISIGLGPI